MVRINTICFRAFALVIDKKYCCSNYASLYNSTLSQILLKKSNSHQQLKKGLFLLIRVKTFFNTFLYRIPSRKHLKTNGTWNINETTRFGDCQESQRRKTTNVKTRFKSFRTALL